MMPPRTYRVTTNYTQTYDGRTGPDTVHNYDSCVGPSLGSLECNHLRLLQLGLFLSNINFWTEVQSYGNLSYLRPSGFCMLGAVVTSSGQSVNQPVYTKSVRRRRIAIADTYRAEDNADIILVTWPHS